MKILKLLSVLLFSVSLWASTTTLSGTIQDAQGNPLNGTLVMSLPVPAQDTTTNTAVSPAPVYYKIINGTITGFGSNAAPKLYDVATLQPQNLYYITKAFDTGGNLQFWGYFSVTGTTYNIGAATPTLVTTSNISYVNPATLVGNNIWSGLNSFTAIPVQIYGTLGVSAMEQLRIGADSTDTGMYLLSIGASNSNILAGAGYNGTNFIAKATTASDLNQNNGQIQLFTDTGLTPGSSYTPTNRFNVLPAGPLSIPCNITAPAVSAANTVNLYCDSVGNILNFSANGAAYTPVNTGSSGYNAIQQNGAGFTPRPTINFVTGSSGVTVADDSGGGRTGVTFPSTYRTVQQAGAGVTQRTTINFTGSGVTVVDNPGQSRTDVTITNAGAIADSQLSSNVSLYDQVAGGRANDNATFGHGTASFAVNEKAGDGNGFTLRTPDSATTNTASASISLFPGNSNGTANGANASFSSGGGGATNANGGIMQVFAGGGSGTGTGGQAKLFGGSGGATGAGGPVSVLGGNAGGGNQSGGGVTVQSGTSTGNAGGGLTLVQGGTGGGTSGQGGQLTLQGGTAGAGNGNGGIIFLTPGTPTGAGVHGRIEITGVNTTPGISVGGDAAYYVPSGDGTFRVSENGGSYFRAMEQTGPGYDGWCSGVASPSVTLFLFGIGINTTQTCTQTSAPAVGKMVTSPGILRNLFCKSSAAGTAAGSGVVTVNKNGAGTSLTCTFGTTTSCSDTGHVPTVAAGDNLTIQFTTQAAETLANVSCAFEKN